MSATTSELIERAESLRPWLAERSRDIEAHGSLPQPIAQRLAEAGMCRLLTPIQCNGLQVDVASYVTIIETLARGDASATWCAFISCTSAMIAAYLPADEANALFSAPGHISSGVFAPRGKAIATTQNGVSGYTVNGQWFWGSGTHNADSVVAGCLVLDDNRQPVLLPDGSVRVLSVVLTSDQIRRHQNWDAVGLKGTGSSDFEAQDAFVPASRTASLQVDLPIQEALYRFPVFGLLAISIAAVGLGIGRRAIDELIDLASSKVPQASSKTLAQRSAVQEAVARAEANWRSARCYVMDTIDQAWTSALAGDAITPEQRRDIRLATTHAVHGMSQVVDRMYTLGGGNAIFGQSALQRCLRDIHVATQHMMVSESTFELTGRMFLGLPTQISML